MDVSICAAAAHDGVSVQQRFARREKSKHDRYAGGELIPFAVDPRGSWGSEAKAWVQHIIGQIPDERRSQSGSEMGGGASTSVDNW